MQKMCQRIWQKNSLLSCMTLNSHDRIRLLENLHNRYRRLCRLTGDIRQGLRDRSSPKRWKGVTESLGQAVSQFGLGMKT
jgi:hypothetical protein